MLLCCVLLCPTPKDPEPCFGERAGPSAPHLFWVWRCCGCGCCGCCWFGLPWTTFRRTPPPLDPPPPDRPKFRSFSSLSRHRSLFLRLSGCLLAEFWWCFEHRNPEMCTFRLSGCRVKPRRPHQTGPPGLHTTAPELQTCTFQFQGTCASKHHQNSTRRHPKKHRNSETVAGKGRKSAKFWAPTLSGPHPFGLFLGLGPPPFGAPPFWAPPFWAPLFQGLGPPPIGAPPFGAPFWVKHKNTKIGQSRSKNWPKSVWPKSIKTMIGQSRSKNWPKSVWPKSVN